MESKQIETKKVTEVPDIKNDISSLREQVKEANSKKEELFEKKATISKEIISKINDIKSIKKERDSLTDEVKTLKIKRSNINKQIKDKSDILNTFRKEKNEVLKDKDIKFDPIKLKEKVYALEFKMQTEAMSFSKEKVLMKTINSIKKQYKEMEGFTDVIEKVKNASKDFRKIKSEADKMHRDIIFKAKKSQSLHEKMISLSKEVDDLKKEEKEQIDLSSKAKNEYRSVNEELRKKFSQKSSIAKVKERAKKKSKIEKKKQDEKTLKQKGKEVEEKIKGKKKLTTEDLLIFQGMGSSDMFKKSTKKNPDKKKEIISAPKKDVVVIKKENKEITEVKEENKEVISTNDK